MTMTLVSTVTVGSGGAASIDFTSIPQTGTDLLVVLSGRSTGANGLYMTLNSDTTASRYAYRMLYGTGSSTGSINGTNSTGIGGYIAEPESSSYTANTFDNTQIYIPNYSGSTTKSFSVDSVAENNATGAAQSILAGSYNQTTAITALKLSFGSPNNFAQYSTASLYTITKGSGGATVS